MTRHVHLLVVLALSLAGCEKHYSIPPSNPPLYSNDLAAARARSVQDGLSPLMSDDQILRAIGHDPSALKGERVDGADGHSTTYTNETTYIIITRSLVTGISVLRLKPKDQNQLWMLEKR